MNGNARTIGRAIWALLVLAFFYTAFFMLAGGEPGRGSCVTRPDPQGGLVFVVLPLLQLIGVFIGLAMAALLESSGRAS
ncbi:MAG TPA: hypothetical protein P5567_14250 [Kiritimatiellia bacterium]|nr:hypothetical protein [Kiritimatiellia bacterium]HRZ13604.1 hypothetical protein [Kiritimatiellia bacterium]HSA19300.1 hypothetical protein [Kiritimatiellia bacterium]